MFAISAVAAGGVLIAACGDTGDPMETDDGLFPKDPTATAPGVTPGDPGTDPTLAPTDDPNGAINPEAAVDELISYFDAINAGNYEAAYLMWAGNTEASGPDYDEFVANFEGTQSVAAQVGMPPPEAGGDPNLVEVPVTIIAEQTNGEVERFEGHYTLRYTNDGTAEWVIADADIEEAEAN